MKRILILALVAALTTVALGCNQEQADMALGANTVVGSGTIVAPELSCGYRIRSDAGVNYEPTKLDPEFQQAGLRVSFVLQVRKDMASVCMTGPIADVVSIRKL